MTSNETGSPGVEDILSSAVDRQVAEQRSLREALSGIHEAVDGLRAELEARPTGEVGDAVLERLEARDEEPSVGEVGEELRATLAGLREQLESSDQDVEALAQAVLDLNAALRDWSEGVESRVGSLGETLLGGIGDLASTQSEALESLASEVGRAADGVRQIVSGAMDEAVRPLDEGLAAIRERITDVEEVSRYLQDQADDLDKILRGLSELPDRVEAVVAQALRRALTVRASFERDARRVIDDAVAPFSEPIERLGEPLEVVAEALEGGRLSEDLRRAGLRNLEVATRMEEFQERILERLEESEARRREREDELADAIEGLARRLEEQEKPSPSRAKGKSGSSKDSKSTGSGSKSKAGSASSSSKKTGSTSKKGSKKGSGAKKGSGSSKKGSGSSGSSSKKSSKSSSKKSSSSGSPAKSSSSGGRSRASSSRVSDPGEGSQGYIPV